MIFPAYACLVAAFLSTWALIDFVLVFVTSLFVNNTELACDKRYAPLHIAVIGPPDSDPSLQDLDACGSTVTEFGLKPEQNPIELVWRVLETAPGVVLVRDVANDSLGVAHLVRKAGYSGVLALYSPKLPDDACKRICDANSHLVDGVASDCAGVIKTFTWVATRHKHLSLEFLADYAKLVDTISYHYERKHTLRAAKYAHRAVWRAAGEERLYSAAKRLTDEMISGMSVGHRIEALERIVVQAHTFRGE